PREQERDGAADGVWSSHLAQSARAASDHLARQARCRGRRGRALIKALESEVRYADGGTDVTLKGVIDEPTSQVIEDAFSGLIGRVRIELKGVERITSYGLGVLMRLLGSACKTHEIEFFGCPEGVIDQFQMLGFARYGKIASMFIRFQC